MHAGCKACCDHDLAARVIARLGRVALQIALAQPLILAPACAGYPLRRDVNTFERFSSPCCAMHLPGRRVAQLHEQRLLVFANIALPQFDAIVFRRQAHQPDSPFMIQTTIARKGDRLFLYRGVDRDLRKACWLHCARLKSCRDDRLEKLLP